MALEVQIAYFGMLHGVIMRFEASMKCKRITVFTKVSCTCVFCMHSTGRDTNIV